MPEEITSLCQCGCSQPVRVKKGNKPARYIHGHNRRKFKPLASLLSDHLCECGCGRHTKICWRNDKSHNYVRGQPQPFCIGHHKPEVTTSEGFWKRVDVRSSDECWPWKRYINDAGYGVTRTSHNKAIRASRIAYELANGPIPDGMFVCHHCDNPACCNPAHLFLGTPADNTHDMDRKGRRINSPHFGEANGCAKITEAQVKEIRQLAASGISYEEIGCRFKISDVHAGRIAMRRSWQHLP